MQQYLDSRLLPPLEQSLSKLPRNATALNPGELNLNTALIALPDVLDELVELVRQLAVVKLATFGSLADGEPFDEPFRVGLNDDLTDTLRLQSIILSLGSFGSGDDEGVDLLEGGDGCANLDLTTAEVRVVDEGGVVVEGVVFKEHTTGCGRRAFAADFNDDGRLVARACVVAVDDLADLAWSLCERLLLGVCCCLEWPRLLVDVLVARLLAGAKFRSVFVLVAVGEWNHAAALCPGHLRWMCLTRRVLVFRKRICCDWRLSFVVSKATGRQIPVEHSMIL